MKIEKMPLDTSAFIDKYSRPISVMIIIASALLLIFALYYPFIKSSFRVDFPAWLPDLFNLHDQIEEWIIKKGKIPVGNQYLLGIIRSLFADGSIFLGVVILLFSIVFPVLKIVLCTLALLPYGNRDYQRHNRIIKAVGIVSKWSMADVFIVAVIIVMFKAKGFNFSFRVETGLYCYALSAILSSLCIMLIMHRAERLKQI